MGSYSSKSSKMEDKMSEERKVLGSFDGINGNVFMLMGYFQQQATRQRFSKEWIKKVLDEAMRGDYNHLVGTLLIHMEKNDA